MREHINFVIEYLKKQPVEGCITGSSLLGEYWDGMDVDCFCYGEKQFTKLLNILNYDDRFQLLSEQELWKFNQWINNDSNNLRKLKIITIKFMYNTCIPVNIIVKDKCDNVFSVISTFDMDIVAKGIDIQSGQTLDLTGNSVSYNVASPNKWNSSYYNTKLNIWQVSRIVRQLTRSFKYYNRGFDVTPMIETYMSIIKSSSKLQNLFKSDKFEEQQLQLKLNGAPIIKYCEEWLLSPRITTEEEFELLNESLKKL